MARGKLVRHKDELMVAISNDKQIQEQLTDMVFDDFGGRKQRNTNPQKTLIAYSEKLKKIIQKKLDHSGLQFDHALFEPDLIYDSKRKCVVINFAWTAYQPNLFKDHISFVPVLLNYGWEVKQDIPAAHARQKTNRIGMPTFAYYQGSYFITDAIHEFNQKYGDKNLYAHFLLGDTNITMYTGSGKLPYIKS